MPFELAGFSVRVEREQPADAERLARRALVGSVDLAVQLEARRR